MGVRNYLIEGVSGAGKTIVAEELLQWKSAPTGPIAGHDQTCWDGVIELTNTTGALYNSCETPGQPKQPFEINWLSWIVRH